MATIPMIPVGPVTTLNRSILLTERRMSGTGGDDFICGHCGHVMLEGFDPSTVSGNPVYQCGVCENNNDLPFAASDGRHWPSRWSRSHKTIGDHPLESSHGNCHRSSRLDAKRRCGKGNAGVFSWRPACEEIRSNLPVS